MTEKTSLSDKELEEFIEFVNKFKTYTKPTNRQKELINHDPCCQQRRKTLGRFHQAA